MSNMVQSEKQKMEGILLIHLLKKEEEMNEENEKVQIYTFRIKSTNFNNNKSMEGE